MKKTILSMLLIGAGCAVFAQTTGDSTMRTQSSGTGTWNTGTWQGQWNGQTWTGNTNMNGQTMSNQTWNNSQNMNTQNTTGQTITDQGNYNAYGTTPMAVPYSVQTYFHRDYPNASGVMWNQENNFYHGAYMENGRFSHVYYDQAGNRYNVALPVTQTYVADDVIGKVHNTYGPTVYDITSIKGAEGQTLYHVRVLENGTLRSHYHGEDGATVSSPYRTEEMSSGTYSGMDAGTSGSTGTSTEAMGTSTEGMNTKQVKEMKIKEGKNETKIKTEYTDGTETKTKIKKGEVKVKTD